MNANLEGLGAATRRLVHHPRGYLQVLAAQGAHHIARGETNRVDPVRVQPYPHGVLTGTQQSHPAHAVDARQGVAQAQHGVIGDVQPIVGFFRRVQVDDHQDVGRVLLGADPQPADRFRQARLGQGDTILYLHLRIIQVGAQGEGDGDAEIAIAGGLRVHVQHVFHAVDLLFQWRGDRVRHHFRARAGVGCPHLHRRGGHLGVLGNGQGAVGQRPHQGDKD